MDPDAWVLVQLGLVTLVAATLQGAAGFGFGLLALPAYMVILDSTDAVPLVIILSLILSAGLAAKIRHEVHRPLLVRFLAGTALGLPRGAVRFSACGRRPAHGGRLRGRAGLRRLSRSPERRSCPSYQ